MKIKEIRELSDGELLAKRRDMKQEVINLRVQQAIGQLQNTSRFRVLRRDLAKIETILSAKRQAAAK
jgi:large subunit ribosomal protein L29